MSCMTEMHPTSEPADRWEAVPRRLLHQGMDVAYFNGYQFFVIAFAPQQREGPSWKPCTGQGRAMGGA
jgi:hypothetical protein